LSDDPNEQILIVGAGPTGLGAAWRLDELGHTNWKLVDQRPYPGGLARSMHDDHGFVWDFGGHVGFSHYEYYDRVIASVLQDESLSHERQAWIVYNDKGLEVPYPFQNNLWRLPDADREPIINELEQMAAECAQSKPKPANFDEWLIAGFGEELSNYFLRPYNFRVWAYPPETMSTAWVGERVATVDVERVKANVAAQQDMPSWGPNNKFLFPTYNGTGQLFRSIFASLPQDHVRMETQLVGLDPLQKVAALQSVQWTKSGPAPTGPVEFVRYGTLLTTLPLTELIRVIDQTGRTGSRAAELAQTTPRADIARWRSVSENNLLHSSTNVVGVGVYAPQPAAFTDRCWYYFPEEDVPFYRCTVLSNYSPNMVPIPSGEHYSLMCEVSESQHRPVDHETIADEVLAALIRIGWVPADSHGTVSTAWTSVAPENPVQPADNGEVSLFYVREEYGYPTPSLDRDEALDAIQPDLARLGVLSRGRFGGWRYEVGNMDHSFMQGVEAADATGLGVPEVTYVSAAYVNGRRNGDRPAIRADRVEMVFTADELRQHA
jgi:protoporphyrinogen oxidase